MKKVSISKPKYAFCTSTCEAFVFSHVETYLQLKDLKAKHEMLERLTATESNVDDQQQVEEQGGAIGVCPSSLEAVSDNNSVERHNDDVRDNNQHEETSLQTELHSLLEEKAFLTELLKMRASVNSQDGPLGGRSTNTIASTGTGNPISRSHSELVSLLELSYLYVI